MYACPTFHSFRSAMYINLQNKQWPCDYASREFCYEGNVVLLSFFEHDTIDLGTSVLVLLAIIIGSTLLSAVVLDRRVKGSGLRLVPAEVMRGAAIHLRRRGGSVVSPSPSETAGHGGLWSGSQLASTDCGGGDSVGGGGGRGGRDNIGDGDSDDGGIPASVWSTGIVHDPSQEHP
jgi:hypothetical protein